ncbi:MAG: hypothetical protein WC045_03175 [Patescibacteria group bacterium]
MSSYIGKEYIEDTEKIEVLIKYSIRVPDKFGDFNMDLNSRLKVREGNGVLYINIHRSISKKLFSVLVEDFASSAKGDIRAAERLVHLSGYIIGYIRPTLPIVVDEIYKRKYLGGHILTHSVSMVDVFDVSVLDSQGNGVVLAWWPSTISSFPPSSVLAAVSDAVYIRDYIEVMASYFNYNIDDGIRRSITSLENYFIHYGVKPSIKKGRYLYIKRLFRMKERKFKRLVNYLVSDKYYSIKESHLRILRNNILYIYHVRNKIVHDKTRISASDSYIAKKAIGTLSYIYQNTITSQNHLEYIKSLTQQFIGIEEIYFGINLDEIEHHRSNTKKESNSDIDDFMFSGLEITKAQKKF